MAEIFTIGHSTRPIAEFIDLLKKNGVEQVIDIRTIPRSRYNPQYEQEALNRSLQEAGMDYIHMKNLGGLRPKVKDSINTGWRNESFRNYADYMQTPAFSEAVEELIARAKTKPSAIMCAEAVPWRCHRSLVADALTVRGVVVRDIMDAEKTTMHQMTPFAVTEGTHITYPKEETNEPTN